MRTFRRGRPVRTAVAVADIIWMPPRAQAEPFSVYFRTNLVGTLHSPAIYRTYCESYYHAARPRRHRGLRFPTPRRGATCKGLRIDLEAAAGSGVVGGHGSRLRGGGQPMRQPRPRRSGSAQLETGSPARKSYADRDVPAATQDNCTTCPSSSLNTISSAIDSSSCA